MKKNKKIILGIIITLLMLGIGITYAVFTYQRDGGKSKLVLGDIWMKYRESEGISLSNALPGDPYSDYFEFTITGTNTYEEKDIWYDIVLTNGEVPSDKLEDNRIDSKYLKFKLVEVISEDEEKVIFEDKVYDDLNNRRVYVSTIPKNTKQEYNKTYRMYMTISNDLIIGNTSQSHMNLDEYAKAFASVKVNVSGDLNPRLMPNTMARLGTESWYFWSSEILSVRDSDIIKEVSFIKLDNEEIDRRYNNASIKSDLTTDESYPIKAWLEENEIDENKSTLYIASEDVIYFPNDISDMFRGFDSIEKINFDNINTSQVEDMSDLFSYCKKLVSLDLSKFDTSIVTNMFGMFMDCQLLTEIIGIENFDTSNVNNMDAVFYGNSSLISLDLSKWNTSKVTTAITIFQGCESLENLDVSGWNVKKITDMSYMFNNLKSLKSLDLSSWDMSNVTNTRVMFQYVSKATSLKIPNNIKVIGSFMFNHNYAHLGDTFTIPKSVEEMGYSHMWYGFGTTFNEFIVESGNKNFKTVDGILYTSDGKRLISVPTHKTNSEKTIEIPEGVTFINENAFSTNKKIETLILPDSYVITRYVGKSNSAYEGDNVNTGSSLSIGIYLRTNIGTYIVKDTNPNYTSVDGCLYSKDGSELVAVPWQFNGALSIKEGTTKIGQEAFWTYGANATSETTRLTSVHIPASVVEIETNQITALNKLVGRITITIDSNNPNYTLSGGKIVSK